MKVSSNRAKYVSIFALALSIVFFIASLIIGNWSGFFAVSALSWLILASAIVNFVLVIQFHQQSLAEQEKLDTTVSSKDQTSTIFQGSSDLSMQSAQKRLVIVEKWVLPIFSGILAVYAIAVGLYLLGIVMSPDSEVILSREMAGDVTRPASNGLIAAMYMTAIAFVTFLVSRYATGLSSSSGTNQWKPLRASGSYLLGVAILAFAAGIGLALAQFRFFFLINIVGWVVPILLVLLGAETALNVIFDIYRPRLQGQYNRSALDTRLLGTISEPGKIFHTAAETIDYQFGFKVSQTWFYKLLEKAVIPLLLFSALILYLMSSVVILGPNEQAVIERFGNPLDSENQPRIVGPGLTIKYPWPIDIAYAYETGNITEIPIGYTPKDDHDHIVQHLLWGEKHYESEHPWLAATPRRSAQTDATVPVSVLYAAIPVQYTVTNIYDFLYNHTNPESLLQSICYNEITKYIANSIIETDFYTSSDVMQQSLLAAGRTQAQQILTERIQAEVDRQKLGIKVVFLGMQGIHPPMEVTADYQKVIGAVQKKQAEILNAHAYLNGNLSSLAGSVEKANELAELVDQYRQAHHSEDMEKANELTPILDQAFAQAQGDIYEIISQAQSYAFERAVLAEAVGNKFADQLTAYHANPQYYRKNQYLTAFEQALENTRKYLVVADENDTQIFIIDAQEKMTPDLYDIGGFEGE